LTRQATASFAESSSAPEATLIGCPHAGPGKHARASLLGLVLALATFLLAPTPASALEHPFLETFGSAAQPSLGNPAGAAVHQATGDLLLIDFENSTVERYNEDGTPSNFSALSGNVIDGHAGEADETPGGSILGNFGSIQEVQIAVDNSGGATDGRIYATNSASAAIDVFSPTGAFIERLTESTAGGFGETCGVAVGPDGSLYVAEFGGSIHRFANPPLNGVSTDFPAPTPCQIAAGAGPTDGFLFVNEFIGFGGEGHVLKLDAATGAVQYTVTSEESTTVSVDPATGHLYSVISEEIKEFNAAGATPEEVSATPLDSAGQGVAVNWASGNLYATRAGEGEVEVFAPGPSGVPNFELGIQKTGNGSGTVTSLAPNPGIECGTECSFEFEAGKDVELKAVAASDSEFSGWSTITGDPGTCTGTTTPCEVEINEATELEAEFSLKPPTVTGLSPTKGPLGGGNPVTITGTDLVDVEEVKFGEAEAELSSLVEVSPTKIEIEAPAHAAGTVDVSVKTPGGTSADTAADDYTYVEAPVVESISPSEGSTAGGNPVEITGVNLAEASKVSFGNKAVDKAQFAENTATTIKLKAPGHAAGSFDVTVTTAGGTSATSPADLYTYVASPAVLGLSPAKGPTTGGNPVTIIGLKLSQATKVEFGSSEVPCPSPDCALRSAGEIEVNAPPHAAGKVNVKVTTLGGSSSNFPQDDYTYVVPVPISPASGGDGDSGSGAPSGSPSPTPAQCVVPRLKGLRPSRARSALAAADCKTGEVSRSRGRKGKRAAPLIVKSSKPGAGATLPAGSEVDLVLGPRPKASRRSGSR
jgi:IPT/TIG domain/PASTA domain